MPALIIHTNVPVDDLITSDILKEASETLGQILGKPEKYVMVLLKGGVAMLCAGDDEPAAFGELVSIGGLGPEKNKDLCAALAGILETKLSVPKYRFYITFQDVKERCAESTLCMHVLHQ